MRYEWMYPTMDQWQKDLLELVKKIIKVKKEPEKLNNLVKNFILLCGRQIGKSEIVAYCLSLILREVPKIKLLIVSGVERQASGLYQKTVNYIDIKEFRKIKGGNPLRTKFVLKNGSTLITEPVGNDGSSARQHTIDGVIFEEMQLIPEEAFAAITPMLFTVINPFIWMLGTAWSTEGYAYDRLSDDDFKVFRVNAEEIIKERPEIQQAAMLAYLEKERKRLTIAQYQQEYLAIPSDMTRQIFPDKLTAKRMNVIRKDHTFSNTYDYVCGVDPAGMGEDEGSISIFKIDMGNGTATQVEHIITDKLYTTQTTERIVELDKRYDFEKIYVDDGGLGFGVFSELLKEDSTRYKTIPLNNSARPLDYKDEKKKKILYNDMIFNLLNQMEKGKVSFLKDAEIRESLKSYKFEYSADTKRLIISSNYNHPVQSIMRAVWHLQGKDLNPIVYSIKI